MIRKRSHGDNKYMDQEILQNDKQINLLEYELRKLQIRRKQIQHPEVGMNYDLELKNCRQQIKKANLSIKELNRQNILRQKKIEDKKTNHVQGKQIRQIQLQIYLSQNKKGKLESRLEQISVQNINIVNNIYDLDNKLETLQQKYRSVESSSEDKSNQLVNNYKKKIGILEALGKRRQLMENTYKIQYYAKLKKLQKQIQSINIQQEKISQIQLALEKSKSQLQSLFAKTKLKHPKQEDHQAFMLTQITDMPNQYNNKIESKKIIRLATEGNQRLNIKQKSNKYYGTGEQDNSLQQKEEQNIKKNINYEQSYESDFDDLQQFD